MKLKYDKLLSNFAFNCNLRHYTEGKTSVCGNGVLEKGEGCDCGGEDCSVVDPCCVGSTCQLKVGRCRLTPGFRS